MAQIVTITNPLTGQPAQVDQLEHTAQQIDDAIGRALPGGEIDTLLAGKASVAKPVSIGMTLTDGVTGAARCWRTQDGEVSIHLEIKKNTAFSTWEKLATLPEGYRPGGQRNFGLIGKNGGVGTLSVYASGDVTTNTYIGSGIKEILAYGSFIASD